MTGQRSRVREVVGQFVHVVGLARQKGREQLAGLTDAADAVNSVFRPEPPINQPANDPPEPVTMHLEMRSAPARLRQPKGADRIPTRRTRRRRGPSHSAEGGHEEESDHCPGEKQAPEARAPVLVHEHRDQAQEKAEGGSHEYNQPAKGRNRGPSARIEQHHGRQCGQRSDREIQADSTETGLPGRNRRDNGRWFHIQILRVPPRRACWQWPMA